MLLHDSLDDAVADVSADLPALAATARNQGLAIRRRRRVLASVGTATAVAVLAIAASIVGTGIDRAPGEADISTSTDTFAVGPLSGRTVPITDRAAVAALASAVSEVATGNATQLRGLDNWGGLTNVQLYFAPDSTHGPVGLVQLNLLRFQAPAGRTNDHCGPDVYEECSVRQLPSGDILRTYSSPSPSTPRWRIRVADLLSPTRNVRVVVRAANTSDSDPGAFRTEPVLSFDQLAEIASLPWWGLQRIPVEYVDLGNRLTGYADLGTTR